MPRYYCDYCDTYLTHDSPSVGKQHNAGFKHKANGRSYYQQFEEQQAQSLIDQRIKEHLGQAAAFQICERSFTPTGWAAGPTTPGFVRVETLLKHFLDLLHQDIVAVPGL